MASEFPWSFVRALSTSSRTLAEANTFVQIQGVSMTVFAILAGLMMRHTRRYKVGECLDLATQDSTGLLACSCYRSLRAPRVRHVTCKTSHVLTSTCSGVLLMLYSREAGASDMAVFMTQILQGMGGGSAAIASQVCRIRFGTAESGAKHGSD
jgi:hypothetical protein